MTLLILGGTDDDHAVFMLEHLRGQHLDVELLDSRWFPTELRLQHNPTHNAWTIRLPDGRILTPGQVTAVYWRCYNGVLSPPLPDEEQMVIAGNDARSLFESFLIEYPSRWINGWNGFLLHQTKPVQLARIAALGVQVPATLLSNDAESVQDFASRYGRVIFKPVQGGAHARHVTAKHLTKENLRNLDIAPVTLQEEITGTNIRVFVAGERVLSCEVRAETLDFRDTDEPEILVHHLPETIAEQSLRIARTLDLQWTGIDYRLTSEGHYVFLEANPSPMFRGFESRCGLPLTDALTALLTNP